MILAAVVLIYIGAFCWFAWRRLPRYLHLYQQDDYDSRRLLAWLNHGLDDTGRSRRPVRPSSSLPTYCHARCIETPIASASSATVAPGRRSTR